MSVGAGLVCAGAAAWTLNDRAGGACRARLLFADGAAAGGGPPSWEWAGGRLARLRALRRPGTEWWSVAVGAVLAVLGASVLPLLMGAAGVPVLRRVRLAGAARRDEERRGEAAIALCGAFAGEVRAGRQPGEALRHAARDSGGLGEAQAAVLAAARFG
ncbi:hypothetical protein OK074_2563, partial [Actinobacteria bacterium OK074]